jgi:hypothetical protein
VTGGLTEESYARAALTYLVEPADRRLARLLREHGAVRTLDAIKSGRPIGPGTQSQWARAMEQWRVRLPDLPRLEQLLAFRESGDQADLFRRKGRSSACPGPAGAAAGAARGRDRQRARGLQVTGTA